MAEECCHDGLPRSSPTRLVATILGIAALLYVPLRVILFLSRDEEARRLEAEGKELLRAQKYPQAVAVWKELLRKRPRAVQARLGLGIAYTQMGRYGDAEKSFDAALAVSPRNTTVLFNRALLYLHRGDEKRAVKELRRVLAIDPQYPDAYYHLGFIAEHEGDAAAARQMYIKELNVNPASAKAWYRLELLNE